jgi:hypothetical protein
MIKYNGPGTGGTLVDGKNEFFHGLFRVNG